MRFHATTALVLTACASSHALPMSSDSGAPMSDAGGSPDAPAPASGPCEDRLVAERGRCVGWLPAAPLPFEVGFPGDPSGPGAPELVRVASSGELVLRSGGALLRYLPAEDRFEELLATDVVPADVPSKALPKAPYNEYGRVLGWLDDGTRVIAHVRYYAVTWVAERDDRGDGAWQTTVQPDFLFEPAVAYPIDERSILFAGRMSGIYVAAAP